MNDSSLTSQGLCASCVSTAQCVKFLPDRGQLPLFPGLSFCSENPCTSDLPSHCCCLFLAKVPRCEITGSGRQNGVVAFSLC